MKGFLIGVLVIAVLLFGYLRFKSDDAVISPEKSALSSDTVLPSLPRHITIQEGTWPPTIRHVAAQYSCNPSVVTETQKISEQTINGRTYCIDSSVEGAAGSSYATLTYTTPSSNGSGIETTTFTLRYVHCGNYDDPERTQCTNDRDRFDINTIVDSLMP